jgi:hypothetical protein
VPPELQQEIPTFDADFAARALTRDIGMRQGHSPCSLVSDMAFGTTCGSLIRRPAAVDDVGFGIAASSSGLNQRGAIPAGLMRLRRFVGDIQCRRSGEHNGTAVPVTQA